MGALDYRGKRHRRLKKVQQKDYVRLTRDGMVAYRRGDQILYLPTAEQVRNRLIELLEEGKGDPESAPVTGAFNKIVGLLGDNDQLIAGYNRGLYELMKSEFEKLVVPLCPWCQQQSCWCCWECGGPGYDHKPTCKYKKYSKEEEETDAFSAFGL